MPPSTLPILQNITPKAHPRPTNRTELTLFPTQPPSPKKPFCKTNPSPVGAPADRNASNPNNPFCKSNPVLSTSTSTRTAIHSTKPFLQNEPNRNPTVILQFKPTLKPEASTQFCKTNPPPHLALSTIIPLMPPALDWILFSPQGTVLRIVAGLLILSLFAFFDIRKNGFKNSRRIREYAFLAICTLVALFYGAINDFVTFHISWQYFYFGKGISEGPPDSPFLQIKAILLGMKSSWTPGLLAGAVLLVVNNPTKKLNPLPFKYLYQQIPLLLIPPLLLSPVLGLLGYLQLLKEVMPDSQVLYDKPEIFQPARFMMVWGIHLGAYLGGIVSILWVALKVHFAKRSQQKDEIRSTPL